LRFKALRATARLAAENETSKECSKTAQHAGVKCPVRVACARQLSVIEFTAWGQPLTNLIKNDKFLSWFQPSGRSPLPAKARLPF